MADSDPRVFFAAERTLLAWVRTAIALIGLGFVVARFSLFLQLVDQQAGSATHNHVSPLVGGVLALLGAVAAATASFQHRRFCRSLPPADVPILHRPTAGLVVGYGVAITGLVLAAVVVV